MHVVLDKNMLWQDCVLTGIWSDKAWVTSSRSEATQLSSTAAFSHRLKPGARECLLDPNSPQKPTSYSHCWISLPQTVSLHLMIVLITLVIYMPTGTLHLRLLLHDYDTWSFVMLSCFWFHIVSLCLFSLIYWSRIASYAFTNVN